MKISRNESKIISGLKMKDYFTEKQLKYCFYESRAVTILSSILIELYFFPKIHKKLHSVPG